MARLHWRPDLCRRHPRPARSQRPPHRSRRRQPEAPALQTNCKGLTTGLQLAKTRPPARCPPARRHHLVSPGDIISESAGDFVGICKLTGPAVVEDRTAHALHRLLRAVAPALLALSIAEWIVVRDLPHGGLRAVALPVASIAFAHNIPAVFMAPMIVA